MKRIAAIAVAVLSGLSIVSVWAQEPPPPPIPHTITLVELAPGSYRLDVRGAATAALGAYEVAASVVAIGSDNGVVIRLAGGNDDEMSINLQLPLDGMRDEGCYRVGFFVRPTSAEKQGSENRGAGIDTRGCVDSGGRVTFPAFDRVIAPPPAPPSEVRMVRVPGSEYPDAGGDTWRIDWTDNSDDEIAFDPGIILMDKPWGEGGSALAGIELPEVPANQTSIGSIGFFFAPDGPPEPVCGYALVLVFAVGGDSVSVWPGNTTVPACFGRGTISFPEAGGGGGGGHRALSSLAAVAASIGVALAACGLYLREAPCSRRMRKTVRRETPYVRASIMIGARCLRRISAISRSRRSMSARL